MSHDETNNTDRRAFLQAGALATAAALSLPAASNAQDADQPPIPRRKLGKTGVEITMLDQGSVRGQSFDKLIRYAYSKGIRTFDTAKVYGTEAAFKRWFAAEAAVRKQIFLITKDMPKRPTQIPKMIDERLKAMETDYIDLFFVHGLGDDHKLQDAVDMVKGVGEIGKEFREAADAIKKSGKVKFIGFSSHHKDRAAIIQAAAEGGIVDAIMLQYTAWLDKDSPLNKALDSAHKADIGLITMKQIAAFGFGDQRKGSILDDVVQKVPNLKERNLTPFQGLLHAIWTDERLSASCVSMKNIDQIRDNTDAARRFTPMKEAVIAQLRDAMLGHGPTLCGDCDGRCMVAAGTKAELGNLTRFLTYHEHHGDRSVARQEYSKLDPAARDWSDADLAAARAACPSKLDFAKLLPEVDRHLA
jgi:uncharacterized protein